jgi:hypothetical protein
MSSKSIRQKRSDTKIGNIEKDYGVDLGVRSDMKLGNYLEKKGFSSMSKAIKSVEKNMNQEKEAWEKEYCKKFGLCETDGKCQCKE